MSHAANSHDLTDINKLETHSEFEEFPSSMDNETNSNEMSTLTNQLYEMSESGLNGVIEQTENETNSNENDSNKSSQVAFIWDAKPVNEDERSNAAKSERNMEQIGCDFNNVTNNSEIEDLNNQFEQVSLSPSLSYHSRSQQPCTLTPLNEKEVCNGTNDINNINNIGNNITEIGLFPQMRMKRNNDLNNNNQESKLNENKQNAVIKDEYSILSSVNGNSPKKYRNKNIRRESLNTPGTEKRRKMQKKTIFVQLPANNNNDRNIPSSNIVTPMFQQVTPITNGIIPKFTFEYANNEIDSKNNTIKNEESKSDDSNNINNIDNIMNEGDIEIESPNITNTQKRNQYISHNITLNPQTPNQFNINHSNHSNHSSHSNRSNGSNRSSRSSRSNQSSNSMGLRRINKRLKIAIDTNGNHNQNKINKNNKNQNKIDIKTNMFLPKYNANNDFMNFENNNENLILKHKIMNGHNETLDRVIENALNPNKNSISTAASVDSETTDNDICNQMNNINIINNNLNFEPFRNIEASSQIQQTNVASTIGCSERSNTQETRQKRLIATLHEKTQEISYLKNQLKRLNQANETIKDENKYLKTERKKLQKKQNHNNINSKKTQNIIFSQNIENIENNENNVKLLTQIYLFLNEMDKKAFELFHKCQCNDSQSWNQFHSQINKFQSSIANQIKQLKCHKNMININNNENKDNTDEYDDSDYVNNETKNNEISGLSDVKVKLAFNNEYYSPIHKQPTHHMNSISKTHPISRMIQSEPPKGRNNINNKYDPRVQAFVKGLRSNAKRDPIMTKIFKEFGFGCESPDSDLKNKHKKQNRIDISNNYNDNYYCGNCSKAKENELKYQKKLENRKKIVAKLHRELNTAYGMISTLTNSREECKFEIETLKCENRRLTTKRESDLRNFLEQFLLFAKESKKVNLTQENLAQLNTNVHQFVSDLRGCITGAAISTGFNDEYLRDYNQCETDEFQFGYQNESPKKRNSKNH